MALSRDIKRAVRPGFRVGGEHFRGSASYGPPDAGEFSKIFKKFLKKIANNALF